LIFLFTTVIFFNSSMPSLKTNFVGGASGMVTLEGKNDEIHCIYEMFEHSRSVRSDTVQSMAMSDSQSISDENKTKTSDYNISAYIKETDGDFDFRSDESLSSDSDWGEVNYDLAFVQVENSHNTSDYTADLHNYQTEMKVLATAIKKQKLKIYKVGYKEECLFGFNGEFDFCNEESVAQFQKCFEQFEREYCLLGFHERFEPLFGPLLNYTHWDKTNPTPSFMVRQGGKTSRYVREQFETQTTLRYVRESSEVLPSYVFRREKTSSDQKESYLQFTFEPKSEDEGSYYIDVPTLTEGTRVATLPGLVDQILDPEFTNTVLSTAVCNASKQNDYITIFFERRAIRLESIMKECLLKRTSYDPSKNVVMLIQEFIDSYNFWLWKLLLNGEDCESSAQE